MPTPADTFLMYSQIAADIAADEGDPGRRASLLEMSRAWRTLAGGATPTPPGGQQQPQSNDNDKQ